MKLFIYSLLLVFSFGAIIVEFVNDFQSFKLIKYSLNPEMYFIKDRLYFTERLRGHNSTGSQGTHIYYGIIESSKKEGNISGYMEKINSQFSFDKERNKNYLNIWYCPNLNKIMGLIEGELNSSENKYFSAGMIQSWFKIIMFILFIPLLIIVYNLIIKKRLNAS